MCEERGLLRKEKNVSVSEFLLTLKMDKSINYFKMFSDHATVRSLYSGGVFETSTGTAHLLLPPIEWRQFVIR